MCDVWRTIDDEMILEIVMSEILRGAMKEMTTCSSFDERTLTPLLVTERVEPRRIFAAATKFTINPFSDFVGDDVDDDDAFSMTS